MLYKHVKTKKKILKTVLKTLLSKYVKCRCYLKNCKKEHILIKTIQKTYMIDLSKESLSYRNIILGVLIN